MTIIARQIVYFQILHMWKNRDKCCDLKFLKVVAALDCPIDDDSMHIKPQLFGQHTFLGCPHWNTLTLFKVKKFAHQKHLTVTV